MRSILKLRWGMMLARKVIKAKIMDETNNGKLEALEREYANFQKALRGEEAELYSATNTSKLCSRCGSQGLRHNGRFVCPKCGVELNADYNGALNILKRALGYISRAGAALTQPEGGRVSLQGDEPPISTTKKSGGPVVESAKHSELGMTKPSALKNRESPDFSPWRVSTR